MSFRSAPIIQQEEARAAFRFFASEEYQPVPRSAVFTYVVNYLADGTIIFPEGSTAAQVRALVEHWNTTPDVRSVSWLLKHMDLNEIKENHKASEKTFVECFSDSIKQNSAHFRKARQFSSARARHEERIGLFNSAILPSFQKIMFERYTPDNIPKEMRAISEEFGKRHGRGSPRVLEKLFSLMPAIELFAQLMAARNLNPERAVQPQDFWDIEHARVSGAYADAFATVDRGLIDLLGSRSSVPRTRGCRIIRGLGPLASLLREYTNAVERTS